MWVDEQTNLKICAGEVAADGDGLGGVGVDGCPGQTLVVAGIVEGVPCPHQVDDDFAGIVCRELGELFFFVGDDENVGFGCHGIEIVGDKMVQVWNLVEDELAVGAGEVGNFHVAVVYADFVPLADERFHDFHDGGAAEVVGAGLETQTEHADAAFALGGYQFNGTLLLVVVAFGDMADDGCVDARVSFGRHDPP